MGECFQTKEMETAYRFPTDEEPTGSQILLYYVTRRLVE